MDTRPQWRENRKPQQVSRRFGPGRGALERSLRLPAGRRRDGGKGFLGVSYTAAAHAAVPLPCLIGLPQALALIFILLSH